MSELTPISPTDGAVALTTEDMDLLMAAVYEIDDRWVFNMGDFRIKGHSDPEAVITMHWGKPTLVPRPIVYVKATLCGYQVTVFDLTHHIKQTGQRRTIHDGFSGAVGAFKQIARQVLAAERVESVQINEVLALSSFIRINTGRMEFPSQHDGAGQVKH